MSEEDSFIWRTKRGYHMLTHRSTAASQGSTGWPPKPSTGCGGGHLYSEDLLTWFVGEFAFGHSTNASDQCDLKLSSGRMIRLTSRQRPTVLQTSGGKSFLYTGASGPEATSTEYQHSFTLVQELRTQAVKIDDGVGFPASTSATHASEPPQFNHSWEFFSGSVFWFSANASGPENAISQSLISKYPVAILAWQMGTRANPVFRHGEDKLHAEAAALALTAPNTEVLIYIQGESVCALGFVRDIHLTALVRASAMLRLPL